MEKQPVIEFENVFVSYGLTDVLHDINLKIYPDENWVILGANGSGKSTLLKLFSNDLYPNARKPCKKLILGRERQDIFELKNKLGIITNDLHYKFETRSPGTTAFEVVLSGYHSALGIFKHHDITKKQIEDAERVMDFLDILDIKEKKVCEMSTGQLRRCIVGRSLIHDPKLFILDEPTTGLDIKARLAFVETIRKIARKIPVVLITHDITEIFPEITHAALMLNGTIYKSGLIREVLTSENISAVFDADIDVERGAGGYSFKFKSEDNGVSAI